MLFNLAGKRAVVTGSMGLLGAQFCQALSEAGATVIPLDLKTGFDVMTDKLPECDILINNARTDWSGMYRMAVQHEGNVIVNIASIYGVVAPDFRIYDNTEINDSPASYSADKAAVIGLTRHLAAQLAPCVRVNCISPGGVENGHSETFVRQYSARVPLGRMAQADEMNGALIFLCSDASRYVTGHNLIVDGGLTII